MVADQNQRNAAIGERERNVLVDAGAGTGKTTLLVARLVNMVAPSDGSSPVDIGRVAAITFTRRAAGELRLRIRERLLSALAEAKITKARRQALHDALGGLDTAYVGTIHGFADRLLRLRPVEADISPAYEVVEDESELARETANLLIDAAQTGTLGETLNGTAAADRAEEAARTVLDALHAGLKAESVEGEYTTYHGLSSLVTEFVRHRDNPPEDPPPVACDLKGFRSHANEFLGKVVSLGGGSPGVRWLKRMARLVEGALRDSDPVLIFRHLSGPLLGRPKPDTRRDGFDNDDAAWNVWKAFDGDTRKTPVRNRALRDDMMGPLWRWMATRLVRLFPVVIALYEGVKAKHRLLDQVDLLLKLRRLLRDNKAARSYYQALFDHIFVDEFQDTDPLQAEIICYLSERKPRAVQWQDVKLADGKLTLVGDPKQSIYRFRRADIGMYDEVWRLVGAQGCLGVHLSVNFRSAGPLIEWFNDRFERILGSPHAPDCLFDPDTGEVFNQPLHLHRPAKPPRVHVLAFAGNDFKADDYRSLEGEVLARYMRWLVEASKFQIRDPLTDRDREVNYGDIAILAMTTPKLRFLFPALDEMGVPYSARGGTLFLQDRLHRQFLLGLRAIADREDGVAEAALLRPPFFAVDLVDLVHHRGSDGTGRSERVKRAEAAREFVRDLRRRRFERPPGATARDLLEHTAIGRAVALGPNGVQRLERLREICLVLEQTAASEGLDYDAVTARMRQWVNDPVQLDPPHPVGASAVQVMTVHQAKGLEFPVVILWDGRAQLMAPRHGVCWRVERDSGSWALTLDGLPWEEPADAGLKETERRYSDAERKRLVYVAATRARDLVVVPKAGAPGKNLICGTLLADCEPELLEEFELCRPDALAGWARKVQPPARPEPTVASELEAEVAARWQAAIAESARPRFQPAAVSGEAELVRDAGDGEAERFSRKREGRYRQVFGETVHRAIGVIIRDASVSQVDAVRRAAAATGLAQHLDEAAEDVGRAVEALRREGLFRRAGRDLRLEYPVAGPGEGGKLLVGYVDFVSATPDRLDVLDFKTDQPPEGEVSETYPDYVVQVRTYADLLVSAGVCGGRQVHRGLLFTADGNVRWLE